MATHKGIATVAKRAPLELVDVPTEEPGHGEVRVRNQWTSMGPLELHQSDGGLGIDSYPRMLGDSFAGIVDKTGEGVEHLKKGDKVFGFAFAEPKHKSYQSYLVLPTTLVAKLPESTSLQDAVVIPTNFVTAWHTLVTDMHVPLPWPKPADYKLATDKPIIIWGASSSVGQYTIQVLRYYGYRSIVAVASKGQHEMLRSIGASQAFDYRDANIADQLQGVGAVDRILDCIGSQSLSLAPLAKVAKSGSTVAVMLPVIIRDATGTEEPEYTFDAKSTASWAAGVEARGVRTHFYLNNKFHEQYLQPEIMPTLIAQGVIKANKTKLVEGSTMLERAQKSLNALRGRQLSGEKQVWKLD